MNILLCSHTWMIMVLLCLNQNTFVGHCTSITIYLMFCEVRQWHWRNVSVGHCSHLPRDASLFTTPTVCYYFSCCSPRSLVGVVPGQWHVRPGHALMVSVGAFIDRSSNESVHRSTLSRPLLLSPSCQRCHSHSWGQSSLTWWMSDGHEVLCNSGISGHLPFPEVPHHLLVSHELKLHNWNEMTTYTRVTVLQHTFYHVLQENN